MCYVYLCRALQTGGSLFKKLFISLRGARHGGGDSLSLVCLCCEQIRDQQAISPTEENVLIKIKAVRSFLENMNLGSKSSSCCDLLCRYRAGTKREKQKSAAYSRPHILGVTIKFVPLFQRTNACL
jgi:hypothetical protein